jgi:hypothetical protein
VAGAFKIDHFQSRFRLRMGSRRRSPVGFNFACLVRAAAKVFSNVSIVP